MVGKYNLKSMEYLSGDKNLLLGTQPDPTIYTALLQDTEINNVMA